MRMDHTTLTVSNKASGGTPALSIMASMLVVITKARDGSVSSGGGEEEVAEEDDGDDVDGGLQPPNSDETSSLYPSCGCAPKKALIIANFSRH